MIFSELEFIFDEEPHDAPLNMAIDEVLLREIVRPILRIYRWNKLSVSFGYFDKHAPIKKEFPNHALVRRWTGGGIVVHEDDMTYSLLVPRGADFLKHSVNDSYRMVHQSIADMFRESGMHVMLTGQCTPKISPSCFENATCHDLMHGENKIAGAAQRRTRFGLLHQGSVQGIEVPSGFPIRWAQRLGVSVFSRTLENGVVASAEELAKEKYATPEWNEKF